jgi:hypothetical protein
MQQLNRRFYREIVPAFIKKLKLFELGSMSRGLLVFENEQAIRLFHPKLLKWVRVAVTGSRIDSIGAYTSHIPLDVNPPSTCKTIQVNETDAYIIGGRANRDYLKLCFKVNLANKEVTRQEDMLNKRHNFGIATIGKNIYAVSGFPLTKSCEVFDT